MTFCLTTQPWIPCQTSSGLRFLSLTDVFTDTHEAKDLDCAPHERVSLVRLLVCITQAALGFPEDSDDWEGYYDQGKICSYLQNWENSFDLFSDTSPFLQVRNRKKGEPVPSTKLIPHLATGNNSLIFDHEGDLIRPLSPARLALALLAFQNFYPLYGAGYKGRGPCSDMNMLHTIVLGGDLREIIVNNCLDEEIVSRSFGIGRPIWELDPSAPGYEQAATMTYLGRLVPRHRNLQLTEDGTGFHLEKDGLSYSGFPAFQEPSSTVTFYKKGSEEIERLLSARRDRDTWRELHTLTVEATQGLRRGAPVVVRSHPRSSNGHARTHVWTGALITDLKAKIIDATESVFHIPSAMFTGPGRHLFMAGVNFAELRERSLKDAVSQYARALKFDKKDGNNMISKNDLKILKPNFAAALSHYWTALDQESVKLLDLVRELSKNHIPADYRFKGGSDPWADAVNDAIRRAFEFACPVRTARQKIAHMKARPFLFPKPKAAKKAAKTTPA